MAVIEELFAVLGFKVEGEQNLQRFSRGMDGVGKKVQTIARDMSKFGAIAAGAIAGVGAGLLKLANDAAGPLDGIGKAADRIGITVEQVQRLGFAAEQSGSSQAEMTGALETMTARLAEAARGSGRAKTVLDAYGISATNAQGKVKDANEFFLELADHMQTMSEAESLDLAQKLGLSRGLVTMLRSGRDAIEADGELAEKAGFIFGRNATDNAEAFNNSFNTLKRSIEGIKTTIGVSLLGPMTAVIDKMQEWLNANREFISQKIEDVIGGIVGHFETLASMDAATLTKFAWAFGLMAFLAFPLASKLVIIAVAIEDILRHIGGGESVFGDFVQWLRDTLGVSEGTAEGIAGVAAAILAIGVLKPAVIFAPLLAGLGAIGWAAGVALAALTGIHLLAKQIAEGSNTPDTPIADIAQIEKAKEWADKLRASWEALKVTLSENIFEPIGRGIQKYLIDPINAALDALNNLLSLIPGASVNAGGRTGEVGPNANRPLSEAFSAQPPGAAASGIGGGGTSTQNNDINIQQTFNGAVTSEGAVRSGSLDAAKDMIRQLGTVAPSPAQ
jgi:TP901 family phage tail tape measure protein